MGKPLTVAKYMTATRPDHPTAHADGRVRVHRAVLYDKVGPGADSCHWCGAVISWFAVGGGELVADHVDGDTWNNDPENLVPSCIACNGTRRLSERTHCSRGHEFTPENTYWRKDRRATRQCRECVRRRRAERAAKR